MLLLCMFVEYIFPPQHETAYLPDGKREDVRAMLISHMENAKKYARCTPMLFVRRVVFFPVAARKCLLRCCRCMFVE